MLLGAVSVVVCLACTVLTFVLELKWLYYVNYLPFALLNPRGEGDMLWSFLGMIFVAPICWFTYGLALGLSCTSP